MVPAARAQRSSARKRARQFDGSELWGCRKSWIPQTPGERLSQMGRQFPAGLGPHIKVLMGLVTFLGSLYSTAFILTPDLHSGPASNPWHPGRNRALNLMAFLPGKNPWLLSTFFPHLKSCTVSPRFFVVHPAFLGLPPSSFCRTGVKSGPLPTKEERCLMEGHTLRIKDPEETH